MTLVYLDTETTGVDPGRHEVWEIAYAVDDGPIQASCVSHQLARADPEALRIGRYFGRVRRGDHWHLDAYLWELDLQTKLSGATLVGANPAFDAAFLTARWGVAPWRYRLLDIEAYAMPALDLDRPLGLAHIAEQLEVLPPDHTAAGDVHTLRECHRTLLAHYGAARTVRPAGAVMTARTYTGTEDADDAWEERETRLRLGPHHDGGTGQVEGWPPWALSGREQRDAAFLEQEAARSRPDPWADEDGDG